MRVRVTDPEVRRITLEMRDRRRALGMSQATIAGQIGLSQRTMWAIESGHWAPELGTLVKLCAALDLTIRFDMRAQ